MIASIRSFSVTLVLGNVMALAGPPLREEAERSAKLVAELKQALAKATTNEARFAALATAMKNETSPNVRRTILGVAPTDSSIELDAFLTNVLTGDADSGLRSQAATALGQHGTEKALPALARAAATDRTSLMLLGDVGGQSSARRSATFALAELAARFPKITNDAIAKLKALETRDDPKDTESLADARLQALFQLSRDESLIKVFHERLKSPDAKVRVRGVVAFRFLKLNEAPAELVATLKDEDPGVRSWSKLVLGEIAKSKTKASGRRDGKSVQFAEKGVAAGAKATLAILESCHSLDAETGTVEDWKQAIEGDHVRFGFATPIAVSVLNDKFAITELVFTQPLNTGVFWLRSGNKVIRCSKFEYPKEKAFVEWRNTAE